MDLVSFLCLGKAEKVQQVEKRLSDAKAGHALLDDPSAGNSSTSSGAKYFRSAKLKGDVFLPISARNGGNSGRLDWLP